MTPFPAWPGAFDARGYAVASLVQAFDAQGYAVSPLRPEHSEAASVNARKRFAFSPRHSFLRCPIVRSVDDFLSCRFSLATSATFACPVQCCVRFAHPAFRNRTSAGDVWHTKRDVSVLLLSSGKLIRGRYFSRADVPAPQERVSRSGAQQSMRKERQVHGLSYPRRVGQRLLFSVLRFCCRRGAG